MTNEKASVIIGNIPVYGDDCYSIAEYQEAKTVAVQALSQEQKSGKCKNCKYFEYDSVAKVDGVPLIVAHEICNKWGNGCKTNEDGYCFMFEPQERSDKG